MLQNGLGELLRQKATGACRIVDLFTGSGSVASFCAQNTDLPVLAVDLQDFAVMSARSIISRSSPLDAERLGKSWLVPAVDARHQSDLWSACAAADRASKDIAKSVILARSLCSVESSVGSVWNAYGGHYFSPAQALTFDYLLKCLPGEEPERSVCLAATIGAASRCAASPGHTAQPFQPTATASKFLWKAWSRDPIQYCRNALFELCPRHAITPGTAVVADALEIAPTLGPRDLVFVDPPYSSVQYSRFYHVLETMSRGLRFEPQGSGRYPPLQLRPQSDFSRRERSKVALSHLLISLASVSASVVLTFPSKSCSNGLSGEYVRQSARAMFRIEEQIVESRFSTMGGNYSSRAPRYPAYELVLYLSPR